MRKKAFTFWEAVVVLAIVIFLAVLIFPIFIHRHPRGGAQRASCQSNLKQIGLGIKQYNFDYDGKFPLVKSGKQGWMDIIRPYLDRQHTPENIKVFQCPSDSSEPVQGTNDYFYNARLAGQPTRKLRYIRYAIMGGDGAPNATSSAALTQLPLNWMDDDSTPAYRHLDGANYLYADGHVRWMRTSSLSPKKAAPYTTTFAPW